MHLILEEGDLPDRPVDCAYCEWHSKAGDLNKGEYFELLMITELFCPLCNKYLGFIQHAVNTNKTQ